MPRRPIASRTGVRPADGCAAPRIGFTQATLNVSSAWAADRSDARGRPRGGADLLATGRVLTATRPATRLVQHVLTGRRVRGFVDRFAGALAERPPHRCALKSLALAARLRASWETAASEQSISWRRGPTPRTGPSSLTARGLIRAAGFAVRYACTRLSLRHSTDATCRAA
jgi:hypothetical protein